MVRCVAIGLALVPLGLFILIRSLASDACCPAGPAGKAVVNADQTVVMIWDAERKTQHFIRQASFRSDATDIGFLVPTPTEPQLEESGNDAFPLLAKLTEPAVRVVAVANPGISCGCSSAAPMAAKESVDASVQVLAEKRVAGFDAQVLAATSAEALVKWLNDHGYSFSPEVEAWAKPYIDEGWKITALKVAKSDDAAASSTLDASALRLTFQTDRPLFPYREPDPSVAARGLKVPPRLLRLFLVAAERYRGELTAEKPWSGNVAWSGKLQAGDRQRLLETLRLPEETGPATFWLTEFEDYWPYEAAPADLYFSPDSNQDEVRRPDIIKYVRTASSSDVTVWLLVAAVVGPLFWTRRRS